MKQILGIHDAPPRHWVGDGFPVRSVLSWNQHGQAISPFLLLDLAGPMQFDPADKPRGVGEHPHRGFETVTIVYDGEVEHLDSTGAGGSIGPGDVQWMTAGSGILHQEFHSREFTRRGGVLEMAQLWVNLPAASKMTPPAYQTLLDSEIPAIALPAGAGTLRVIAGEFDGVHGPASTHTPMNVHDVQLADGGTAELRFPDGWTALLVVQHGSIEVNQTVTAGAGQLVVLDRAGTQALVSASGQTRLLVLSGEPIDEPIAGYGPFVMNTEQEIQQAIRDFNSGRFGRLPRQ